MPSNTRGTGQEFDPEDYVSPDATEGLRARMRERMRKVEEVTSRHMQEVEESGALRHLYGKPLELDDDPNWLATRTLKQAGFSHPLLEQRRELSVALSPIEAKLDRLQRWRERLLAPTWTVRHEDVLAFNAERAGLMAQYRGKLLEVNRAIRDFNLTAPEALHERPITVDDAMAGRERDIPPLSESAVPPIGSPRKSRRTWNPFRRR